MVVVGMAVAIGVLVSILSLGVGYVKMEKQSAAPGRAVILTANADLEGLSTISRDVASKVMAMPGIGKSANGIPLADSEYYSGIRINRKPSGTNLLALRGIGRQGLALRPELRIVAGRMFRAGARRSESFHAFLIMGEFSDLIGLQSEIWPAVQLIQSQQATQPLISGVGPLQEHLRVWHAQYCRKPRQFHQACVRSERCGSW